MHPQRICIYTCTEDIYNLLQIDCRSRSIASFWGPGIQSLYREICWFRASACKVARLSRIIDQLIARGTSFSRCPNWFNDMRATIILENLASFKPFEGSLKSSDPFDGRIKSLKGARPGRKGTTNFLCRQGTPLIKRDLGDTGNLIRNVTFIILHVKYLVNPGQMRFGSKSRDRLLL